MQNLRPHSNDQFGNTVIWTNGSALFTNLNGNMVPCDEQANPIQPPQQQFNQQPVQQQNGLQPVGFDNYNNPIVFKDAAGNIYDNTPNGLVQRQMPNNQIANGYNQQQTLQPLPNAGYVQNNTTTVSNSIVSNTSSDRYKHLENEFKEKSSVEEHKAPVVVPEVKTISLSNYTCDDNVSIVPFCDEDESVIDIFLNESEKKYSFKIINKG